MIYHLNHSYSSLLASGDRHLIHVHVSLSSWFEQTGNVAPTAIMVLVMCYIVEEYYTYKAFINFKPFPENTGLKNPELHENKYLAFFSK